MPTGPVSLGTLVGGLIGLGVPEHEAQHLGDQVAQGRTVVAARSDGPAPWIDDILRHHGATEYRQVISSSD